MSVNWEQLCRNGQLVWDKEPEHRVMLERFYAFWKGTGDESVIASRYPEFYAFTKAQEVPAKAVIEATPSPEVTETVVADVPEKKTRKKKADSPSA